MKQSSNTILYFNGMGIHSQNPTYGHQCRVLVGAAFEQVGHKVISADNSTAAIKTLKAGDADFLIIKMDRELSSEVTALLAGTRGFRNRTIVLTESAPNFQKMNDVVTMDYASVMDAVKRACSMLKNNILAKATASTDGGKSEQKVVAFVPRPNRTGDLRTDASSHSSMVVPFVTTREAPLAPVNISLEKIAWSRAQPVAQPVMQPVRPGERGGDDLLKHFARFDSWIGGGPKSKPPINSTPT